MGTQGGRGRGTGLCGGGCLGDLARSFLVILPSGLRITLCPPFISDLKQGPNLKEAIKLPGSTCKDARHD